MKPAVSVPRLEHAPSPVGPVLLGLLLVVAVAVALGSVLRAREVNHPNELSPPSDLEARPGRRV